MNKVIQLTIAFGTLLMSCSDEIGKEIADPDEPALSYLRVSLHCPQPNTLRSLPTGGETGNGREEGQAYENRIENFMLLFYQGADRSNSPAGTPIDKIMYFDRKGTDDEPALIAVNLPAGEYDLLAVTNTGDLRPALQGKDLGGIRDHLLTQAWKEKEGDYSHFVMTSDGHTSDRVTLCHNPKDNPANATLEVERLAARIDYQTTRSAYSISDPTYGRATVSIQGGVIVNQLKAGSYLLKRVANPDGEGKLTDRAAVEYLGNEIPYEGGIQRNYVVDPWSVRKAGNFQAAVLYHRYYTSFGQSVENWEEAMSPGTPIDGWMRLGYTLENTTSRENQSDAYTTQVVFKATYTPQGFQTGETFYVRDGKIYRTRKEAEEVNTHKLIREYRNGICYYTWRVRHSNDGKDTEKGIMEYAIVRNNIYKLRITDIYALGDEIPFPEPDPAPGPDPDPKPDPDPNPDPDPGPDPTPDPDPNPDPGPDPTPPDPTPKPVRIQVDVDVETWTDLEEGNIYL